MSPIEKDGVLHIIKEKDQRILKNVGHFEVEWYYLNNLRFKLPI